MTGKIHYKLRFLEAEMIEALRARDYKAARRICRAGKIQNFNIPEEAYGRIVGEFYDDNNMAALYLLASICTDWMQTGAYMLLQVFVREMRFFGMVVRLIKNGNITSEYFERIFHDAAEYGNIKLLQFLYKKGLDVNNTSQGGGMTPLMAAVEHSRNECVGFLLENGADIHKQDAEGRTVMDYDMTIQIRDALYQYRLRQRIQIGER